MHETRTPLRFVEQAVSGEGLEADHILIPPIEDLFDVATDRTDFMSAQSFPASDPPSHSPTAAFREDRAYIRFMPGGSRIRCLDRIHAWGAHRSRLGAVVTKEGRTMIRMVTAVGVAPGQEGAWEEAWRTLRQARSEYPGFRGASLLRDSTQPTQYLVLSEWEGHAQLAEAMRGLGWLNRDQMTSWAAEPTRVYDEVVDDVSGATHEGAEPPGPRTP